MAAKFDLIVKAGRVFCADTGLDGPGAVAIADGRIVASGPDIGGTAHETLDFPDCLLLPGLIDMHRSEERRVGEEGRTRGAPYP